jgi:Domain of unknown function (DUF4406)
MYWPYSPDGLRYGKNKLYIGNKMTGIPQFNAPWFDESARQLLQVPSVAEVFNPAQRDRDRGFEPLNCPAGHIDEAKAAGFVARDALGEDWAWIAAHSDGLIIGPDWATSKGTLSEIACHQALALPVWEFEVFMNHCLTSASLYAAALPPIMELGGDRLRG